MTAQANVKTEGAQFTPGPWTASIEPKSYDPSGHWYVVLDTDENGLGEFYGDDHETNIANLRMAAAAPELFRALDELLAGLDATANVDAEIENALAALTKALGL